MNIKKGGRIGSASAIIGNILKIIPNINCYTEVLELSKMLKEKIELTKNNIFLSRL